MNSLTERDLSTLICSLRILIPLTKRDLSALTCSLSTTGLLHKLEDLLTERHLSKVGEQLRAHLHTGAGVGECLVTISPNLTSGPVLGFQSSTLNSSVCTTDNARLVEIPWTNK